MSTKPLIHSAPVAVLGTGSALPSNRLTTMELIARVDPFLSGPRKRLALRLAQRLAIDHRHFSRPFLRPVEATVGTDTAPQLVVRAVLSALSSSGRQGSDLELLIGHTTTPHTLLPSNAAWAAELLGFQGPHIELRQACTGFAAAAVCAAALIDGGIDPVVVAGSEVGSVMLDLHRIQEDPAQLVNLLQMGDGAGAVVLGPIKDSRQSQLRGLFYGSLAGTHAPAISLPHGGSGSPALTGSPITHFEHDFAAIRDHGRQLLHAGLSAAAASGIDTHSIDWWLPQPVNGRLPEICAREFGWPRERVLCDAWELGNLGSAAMWVALDRVRRSGRLRPGERVLVLGAEASKFMYGGFLYMHGENAVGGVA